MEEHSYETFKPICPVWEKDRHSACDRMSFLSLKLCTLVTEFASSTAEWLSLTCWVFEAGGGVLVHAGMSLVWAAVYVAWGLPDVSLRWSERPLLKRVSVQCCKITLHSHFLLPPPFLTSSPVYPLGQWEKKVKTEGFSTPGSVAQDPIHLLPLLQDDFIFQIHKYFPVKAPEVQERACAWLSSVSDLRPLRHRLAPQCACYKNPVMRVMCSVSHCEGSWRGYIGLSRCLGQVKEVAFPNKVDSWIKSLQTWWSFGVNGWSLKSGGGSIGIDMELGRRAIKVLFLELQSTIWADHSFRDKTVIVGHTLFVQRPLSRWNRESGVFKIPGEMAKWVNNWEHKQT